MNVLVVGLNHKIADVDVREKLAFNGPKLEEGLIKFRDVPEVLEAVILSDMQQGGTLCKRQGQSEGV